MTVSLATTWIPRGELSRLQRYLPVLREIYDDIVIVLSPDVDVNTLAAVQAMSGVRHEVMPTLGAGRYLTLVSALETQPDYIHYADMDRLIRWVERYPDELRETVKTIQKTDYMLIGRTEAAFASHPQALHQTERLIHDVFSHLLGGEYDFCAGSKGLTRQVAEFIVKYGAKDYGLGTDTEWSVLAYRAGFELASIQVNGLDWETADRFRDTAAPPEIQRQEADKYDSDPAHWQARVELAQKIIQAGLDALKLNLTQ